MYPGTRSGNSIVIEGRTQATTSLLGRVLLISSLGFPCHRRRRSILHPRFTLRRC